MSLISPSVSAQSPRLLGGGGGGGNAPPAARHPGGVVSPAHYMHDPNSAATRPPTAHDDSHPLQDDAAGGQVTGAGAKRKRNRPALSCSSCKKRKIKCDRRIPCEACIKRGDSGDCHWEDPKTEGPPQCFALASDVERLMRRVAHLETFIASLPSELSSGFSPLPPTESIPAGSVVGRVASNGATHEHPRAPSTNGETSRLSDVDSETEDAAFCLEQLARGKKNRFTNDAGTAQSTPQASTSGNALPADATRTCPQISRRSARTYDFPVNALVGSSLGFEGTIDQHSTPLGTSSFDTMASLEDSLFASLPVPEFANHMIDLFFTTAHISFATTVLHPPTFWIEYRTFWTNVKCGRRGEVDMLYLAVLFLLWANTAVVAATHGTEFDPVYGSISSHVGGEHLVEMARMWFEASEIALALGDWSTKPRARSIQAIVLLFPLLQHFDDPDDRTTAAERYMVWLSAGVRIAQIMGLHQLGPDCENKMPPDDPAWPSGENCLKRELAKRLWHHLCFTDNMTASSGPSRRANLIIQGYCDTPYPLNVNEDDLGLFMTVKARPLEEFTDQTTDLIKLRASSILKSVITASSTVKHLEYSKVLEFEQDFRNMRDGLPDIIRQPYQRGESERITIIRVSVICGIAFQVIRLHIRYLHRGLRDGKYRKSVVACTESAESLLKAQMDPVYRSRPLPHVAAFCGVIISVSVVAILAFDCLSRLEERGSIEKVQHYVQLLDTASTVSRSQSRHKVPTNLTSQSALGRLADAVTQISETLASEVRSALWAATNPQNTSKNTPAKPLTMAYIIKRLSDRLEGSVGQNVNVNAIHVPSPVAQPPVAAPVYPPATLPATTSQAWMSGPEGDALNQFLQNFQPPYALGMENMVGTSSSSGGGVAVTMPISPATTASVVPRQPAPPTVVGGQVWPSMGHGGGQDWYVGDYSHSSR